MIEKLKTEIGCTYDHDFLTVAQAYEKMRGRNALLSRIRQYTDTKGKKPTRVHRLLPLLGSRVWFTTNYDDLLEKTLEDAGVETNDPIREDHHLAYRDERKTTLVKLHGDARDPDSIIITKKDFHRCLRRRELGWDFLRSELAQKHCLFLGYSNRDPDFDQLQADLSYLLEAHLKPSQSVMFGSDEIVRADCEARGIEVVELGKKSGEQATIALAEFLEPIAGVKDQYPYISPERHESESARELVLSCTDKRYMV